MRKAKLTLINDNGEIVDEIFYNNSDDAVVAMTDFRETYSVELKILD